MSKDCVSITKEQIEAILVEKLPTWIKKNLESDYSNPLKEIVDKELNREDGALKTLIRDIITEAVSDPKTRDRVATAVIAKIVERNFR